MNRSLSFSTYGLSYLARECITYSHILPLGLSSVASSVVALRRSSQTVPEFGEHFLNLGAASTDEALYPKLSPGEYVEEPAVFQVCSVLASIQCVLFEMLVLKTF